ncbi:hypothetical protein CEQ90_03150 [Lewinellaceae bacterium SD302]|nr:hypothetical protein CEQ90_03150 [Lewinellaceae bacterium SD302]
MQFGNSSENVVPPFFNIAYFGTPDPVFEVVTDAALMGLEDRIIRRNIEDVCFNKDSEVNVLVLFIDFTDPDETLLEEAGFGLNIIPANFANQIIAVSSPYYSPLTDDLDCPYLLHGRPFLKINGTYVVNPELPDMYIIFNTGLNNAACPNITYNTDLTTTNIGGCEIDLFSEVLHNGMHGLGFLSRANSSSFYSTLDSRIVIEDLNSGVVADLLQNDINGNDGCLIINPQLATALTDNCTGNTSDLSVRIGPGDNVLALNGTQIFVNDQLSHLSNLTACNGNGVDYVMEPFSGTGQVNRELSDEEWRILCEIGYEIIGDVSCGENACFIAPSYKIGADINADHNECTLFLTTCGAEESSMNLSDVLDNTATLDGLTLGTPYLADPALAPFVNLTVNNDVLTVSVDPDLPIAPLQINPSFRLLIPFSGCDGLNYLSEVSVFPDQYCLDCDDVVNLGCDISCYGDFNEFEFDPAISYVQALLGIQTYAYGDDPERISSTDVVSCFSNEYMWRIGASNTNGEYYGEYGVLPLNQPVLPGCSIDLNFDYALDAGMEAILWASENPICDVFNSTMPFGTDVTQTMTCNDGVIFAPELLDEFPSNLPPNGNGLGFCPIPNLTTVTNTYTNESLVQWNFLTFLLPETEGGVPDETYYDLLIDNIEVNLNCPPGLTITENNAINICVGQQAMIQYQLCSAEIENSITVTHSSVNSDVTITANNTNPIVVPSNTCIDVIIDVETAGTINTGIFSVQSDFIVNSPCGGTQTISRTVDVNVNDCVFNCIPNNALVIGDDESCIKLSELIAGCGSGDQMPPNAFGDDPGEDVLVITGQLWVDIDYELTNCEIIMQPGSNILIQDDIFSQETGPRLRVNNVDNNGGIHGCDELWEGITVNYGWIEMTGSIIQDAVHAIYTSKRPIIDVRSSEFIDNHIAFKTEETLYPALDLTGFYGNEVYKKNNLLPSHPAQIVDTYITPFAAIEINDVTSDLTIGLANNASLNDLNRIHGILNGVILNGAQADIVRTMFYDITDDNNAPFDMTGYAINARSGAYDSRLFIDGTISQGPISPTPGNTFTNCDVAVRSQGVRTEIINASARNGQSGFIAADYMDMPISISNSLISNYRKGIILSNSGISGNVDIVENTIVYNQGGAGAFIGLQVFDTGDTPTGLENLIFDNTIGAINSNGIGIQLFNASGYDVTTNEIGFALPNDEFIGIEVEGGYDNRVTNNIISGRNQQLGIGISLSPISNASQEGYVFCDNTIEDLRTAFNVEGSWTGISIIGNTFRGDLFNGIRYGENVLEMSAQLLNGNVWETQTYPGSGLLHDIALGSVNDPAVFFDQQRYEVSNIETNTTLPNNEVTITNYPFFENFWYEELNESSEDCPNFQGQLERDKAKYDSIGTMEASGVATSDYVWNMHASLWSNLLHHPDSFSIFLNDYYRDSVATGDKALVEMDFAMRNIAELFPSIRADRARNWEIIDELRLELLLQDSLESIGQGDSLYRATLVDSIGQLKTNSQALNEDLNYLRKREAGFVHEFAERLSCQPWQEDLQFAQLYALESAYGLTNWNPGAVEADLLAIAAECHWKNPLSVATARHLLRKHFPNVSLPASDCGTNGASESSGLTNDFKQDINLDEVIFEAFPNPATEGFINVSLDGLLTSGKLRIFSQQGQLLYASEIEGNNFNGSTSYQEEIQLNYSGIVFIQFLDKNGNSHIRKVVLL